MRKRLWIGVVIALWLGMLASWRTRCQPTFLRYGISIGSCPDGELRQTAELSFSGLRRGAPGMVTLRAVAHYTTRHADDEQQAAVPYVGGIELSLVEAGGKAPPRPLDASWIRSYHAQTTELKLPDVPDGDYKLHAKYTTRLGTGEVEVALPLYTPARIHVITDRPLYEPGNTVKFRAVVLRARDLAPLDRRPGTWVIKNPDNEVLLEEAAPAGDWGVVAGSFPLDKAARTGAWTVAWRSADAEDSAAFTVEPFVLPRFRVDAAPDRPFYRAGDAPVIKGAVIYSSGAPVANASVEIAWDFDGDWPPPLDWRTKLLPQHATAGPNGRFELAIPKVPDDLVGSTHLIARISAIDAAGDRVEGGTAVLLSRDAIVASAVTELGDGLVSGFNNRLYVRVATPDGRVLPNTKVVVRRAWQPNDAGFPAQTDEDGVASLQIDPGAPVNIVVPPAPWRPAPRPALVTRSDAQELIGSESASLADRVELDRWLPLLAPCAKWVEASGSTIKIGVRVSAGGQVMAAGGGRSALDRCLVDVARRQRLPAGAERLLALQFQLTDPDLPHLLATVEGVADVPAGLPARVAELARGARDCLGPTEEGALPAVLGWRVAAGSKDVELTGWMPDAKGKDLHQALACATSRITGGTKLRLTDEAAGDLMGLVRFTVDLPEVTKASRPQATTFLGYELAVSADAEGHPSTKVRVAPGTVPPLRLRVTPVLAKPGETITAELIRGPAFSGQLPKELVLDCARQNTKAEVGPERRAMLAIAATTEGWCTVTGGGVRAVVYVRPQGELAVTVTPKRDRYAPGERAELAIQTTLGGRGGQAAVGLFGVDESLGQLVPLPGPDAFARVRPTVETQTPAFGVLDGQALALGRIRGANAAAATVQRVSSVPAPAQLDAVVSGAAASHFDPIEELTDRFYVVLAELHTQTRAWEAHAPKGEKMTPPKLAELWAAALDACTARGEKVDDAYGRRMRLSRLPPDLLSLTDPRNVVIDGTRLTEDVENWTAWVAKEKP